MKMKDRNAALKQTLGNMASAEVVKTIVDMPKEDTTNRCGYGAYAVEDELRLIAMLNTLKLEPQYYRSENQTMKELRDLIERLAVKDPYFVAQCIVYSRCKGEGMRSINHLAAALLAPFVSGQEFAKRFYGKWDKKNERGGCIFRPDDMTEIKDVYSALNKSTLSNAMKKGFAQYISEMDAYLMTKYKKTVIDIANLVHPKSDATIKGEDGENVNVLNAIMSGINIQADTWETANSEAGQEVAKAVREGKLSEKEAEKVLSEAKASNWAQLLEEGKLGILAAIRNIRNILKDVKDKETINKLCELISNGERIRKGLIMPYQIDMAYEIVKMMSYTETQFKDELMKALVKGYEQAVPNLATALPGKTAVLVDCSGSMGYHCFLAGAKNRTQIQSSASEKAGLIAATIAKSCECDIVRFGSSAEFYHYDKSDNVFRMGREIGYGNMGGTNIGRAFDILNKKYDRIILISDNECNSGSWVSTSLKNYMRRTGANPYVYAIDMAAYGTTPLKGDRVNYYAGYGFAMFEDISSKEFNPAQHIEKIRKIVI